VLFRRTVDTDKSLASLSQELSPLLRNGLRAGNAGHLQHFDLLISSRSKDKVVIRLDLMSQAALARLKASSRSLMRILRKEIS
jgi:hypothetical protein